MSVQLEEQIAAAQKAAAQVAKQDALRAKANELPALERHAEALKQREAARLNLAAVSEKCKTEVAELRGVVADEHTRLQFALEEIQKLRVSIPQTASRIKAVRTRLQNAVNDAEYAERACGSSLGQDAFYASWVACGGLDKDLSATRGLERAIESLRNLSESPPTGYIPKAF